MELLKQPQYSPFRLDHQTMFIYAGTRGYLDDVSVAKVDRWAADFLRYMDTSHPELGQGIMDSFDFSSETEEALKQALSDFNANWSG